MTTPGTLLDGKYRILRPLGSGGMGAVYVAENVVTRKIVAIKMLHSRVASPESRIRFVREARAAARVRHPNIVDVYDVTESDAATFLVMEYLEGETFSAYLYRRTAPRAEAIRLLTAAMRGVAAAHRAGVVHRDIKPDNIFLSIQEDVQGPVPKVLDFGISKLNSLDDMAITSTGVAIGTPLYMSFEQLQGSKDVDARADVYAFGVILYEIVTGRPPFEADSFPALAIQIATTDPPAPRSLQPDTPPELDSLIRWAISRNRETRVPSLEVLIEGLKPFTSDETRPAPLVAQAKRPFDRSAHSLPEVVALTRGSTRAPLPPNPSISILPHELRSSRARGIRELVKAWAARLSPTPKHEPVERSRSRRVAAKEFETLVPSGLAEARVSIAAFLASVFHFAEPLSREVVRFQGVRISGADDYEYFALLLPSAANAPIDPKLGTRTFAAVSAPLELHLAQLPSGSRKVVIAISDFVDWGRGVRRRILKYRNDFGALVVPLYVKEVQLAHRTGELRRLFDERIASFHPNDNLFANIPNRNPVQMVGMHRELNTLVHAVAQGSRLIVVDGLPGTGRSSLVARAAYEVDEPFQFLSCIDLSPNFDELALRLAELLELAEAAQLRDQRAQMRETIGTIGRVLCEGREPKIVVLEDGDWLVRPLDESDCKPELKQACQDFWTTLQHHASRGRLTVVLTCVRGYPLTQRRIGSWDNPLKDVVHCPVPALDLSATTKFVSEPGLQMNVHFHRRAIRLIHDESGGNLDVVRRICSDIVESKDRDPKAHRLMKVTVTRGAAMHSVRRVAGGGRMSDETRRWLTALEREVVRAIVARRPRTMHELAQVFPGTERERVVEARTRLERIGLIRFGTRYELTIPLLERWVRNDFGRQEGATNGNEQRNFAWLGSGLVLGAALYATVLLIGGRPTVTRSTGTQCAYTVMHPTNIVPGEEFGIQIQPTKCESTPDANLTLTALEGTNPRVDKAYAAVFTFKVGEAGKELKLSIDEGSSDTYGFTLAGRGMNRAEIQMGTDWLGLVSTWTGSLMKALALFSSLAGALGTFFRDVEPIWARYTRRASKSEADSVSQRA